MTIRISSALRQHVQSIGSYKSALQGGLIEVRTGSQPANADAAATGTLLFTLTSNGLSHTKEVQGSGTVTVTGSAGAIDNVTVNGVSVLDTSVPYNTSTTQTATDLAAAINATTSSPEYRASASGNIVTIKPAPGVGTGANTFAVATSNSGGMTTSTAAVSGGVNSVNGLLLTDSPLATGVLAKRAAQTWQGTTVATGTAGWFRFKAAVLDNDAIDSANVLLRLDGSVASSGADATMANPTITGTGVTQTVNSFTLTLPLNV